jgi:hypothetical protein
MLLEGTWPDHVRVNTGLANVHLTEIVRAGGRITDTWLPAFAIALSVQNA